MAKKYNIRVEWGDIVKIFKRYPKHLEKHPEYDLTVVCTDPLGKKITYEKYMLLTHTSYGKQLFVVTKTPSEYFISPECIIHVPKENEWLYFSIIKDKVFCGIATMPREEEKDKMNGGKYFGRLYYSENKKDKKNAHKNLLATIKRKMTRTEIEKNNFVYVNPQAKELIKFLQKPEINTASTLKKNAERRRKEEIANQMRLSPEMTKSITITDIQNRQIIYSLGQLYEMKERGMLDEKLLPHLNSILSQPDWISSSDGGFFYYKHIDKIMYTVMTAPFKEAEENFFVITFMCSGTISKREKYSGKNIIPGIAEVYVAPDSKYDLKYIRTHGLRR